MSSKDFTQGKAVPAWSLAVAGGGKTGSAALKGQAYVLYFYPKADTSGCTKEAQGFQDLLAKFDKAGVSVIGVSRDGLPALEKFAAKYGLSFALGSDAEGKVTEAFGVWVEKSMYGRKYMGIERTTFLVGADGKLAEVWHKVKVPGHAEAVLAAAQAL